MCKAEVDARVKAERLYRQVESEKQRAEASLENVSKARKETYRNLYATRMRLAGDAAEHPGGYRVVVQTLDDFRPNRSNEDDIRNWEWYYLAARTMHGLRGTDAAPGLSVDSHHDTVVTGHLDGTLSLHLTRGRMPTKFQAHATPISLVRWSIDGKWLATVGMDGLLKVWDTKQWIDRIVDESASGQVAFGIDGRIAYSTANAVRIWDPEQGHICEFPADSKYLLWNPAGNTLVCDDGEESALVVDGNTGATIQLLEVDARPDLRYLPRPEYNPFHWSSDGSRLSIASRKKIYHFGAGKWTREIDSIDRTKGVGIWSPDGKRFAVPVREQTQNRTQYIAVTDSTSGEEQKLIGHEGLVEGIAWSPDSQQMASSSRDRTLRLWDIDSASETRTLPLSSGGGPIAWGDTQLAVLTDRTELFNIDPDFRSLPPKPSSFSISPDGRLIALAGFDDGVRIWDLALGQEDSLISTPGIVENVSFSLSDPAWLAGTLKDRTRVIVWNPRNGQEVVPIDTEWNTTAEIDDLNFQWLWTNLAWSGNHLLAIGCSTDSRVSLWHIPTGEPITEIDDGIKDRRALSLSPQGDRILSLPAAIGKVRDTKSGDILFRLTGHSAWERNASWMHACDWSTSKDKDWIATGCYDGTVKIWDGSTGETNLTLERHVGTVLSVAFNATGSRLASGCTLGTIKVWDTETGSEVLSIPAGNAPVTQLAWTPEGTRLVALLQDKEHLQIFDASDAYILERSPMVNALVAQRLASVSIGPAAVEYIIAIAETSIHESDWSKAIKVLDSPILRTLDWDSIESDLSGADPVFTGDCFSMLRIQG